MPTDKETREADEHLRERGVDPERAQDLGGAPLNTDEGFGLRTPASKPHPDVPTVPKAEGKTIGTPGTPKADDQSTPPPKLADKPESKSDADAKAKADADAKARAEAKKEQR